ncbi:MAG: Rpp14/Pop5 family protein [Candidatus Nanoarchaeia archaeon]|jgi:RNase P/RNase MRP subunit POP5
MLDPALREKKRYVVFETLEDKAYETVKDNIYKESLAFLGEKGTGEMGLIFLPEHWSNKRGIVRVNYLMVNELKIVLGLIKGMKTKTIKTTGSLKKAKKIMIGEQ